MGDPTAWPARRDRDPATLPPRPGTREDREGPGLPAPLPVGDEQGHDDSEILPRALDTVETFRFVRDSPLTTTDKIEYAIHGAYSMPNSAWRTANVVYAYTIAAPGHCVCDAVKWAFFDRFSRALLAIPVLLALLFVLNQLPVVSWVVPDQWDVTTWLAPAPAPVDAGVVELPVEPGVGE